MRITIIFLTFVSLIGCSSTQNKLFNLDIKSGFTLETPSEFEFSTLCEQLSVIAYMNLLDAIPEKDLDHKDANKHCAFSSTETHSGYSFGFTYNSQNEQEYPDSANHYPNKKLYSKSTIELNAINKDDSVHIYIKANNQDNTFKKLSYLVDKLLTQDYDDYYSSSENETKTSKKSANYSYY